MTMEQCGEILVFGDFMDFCRLEFCDVCGILSPNSNSSREICDLCWILVALNGIWVRG